MRQLIIARKDLNMSPGKLAAQVSHASMAFISKAINCNVKPIMKYSTVNVYRKDFITGKMKPNMFMVGELSELADQAIFDGIGQDGYAAPIGDDYLLCFSGNCIMDTGYARYLVGSAIMVKAGKDSRIKPLTDIDIKIMRTNFQMGLITLTYGSETFGAYPLEYDRTNA